jgi:hypothetical protein
MLFQAVSSYFQLMRSFSIKDFFHGCPLPSDQNFFDCFEFQWSRKQVMLFSSYFTIIPDGRPGGRRKDVRLEKSILRLTQLSLAGTWAELGNIMIIRVWISFLCVFENMPKKLLILNYLEFVDIWVLLANDFSQFRKCILKWSRNSNELVIYFYY